MAVYKKLLKNRNGDIIIPVTEVDGYYATEDWVITQLGNYYTKAEISSLLNGKYSKPSGGIPKTDLDNSVQTSLGKADTALQSINSTAVTTALGYTPENITNKVTSISSASTDTQYPSAKCVYDIIGDIESLLSEV